MTTNPDTANGALQVQEVGTETALRFLRRTYDKAAELVAEQLFLRFQQSVRDGRLDKEEINLIGEKARSVVKYTSDMDLKSFGFIMKPVPDSIRKANLMQAAQVQLQIRQTTGVGGIELADYWMLDMIKSPMRAWRYLMERMRTRKQADEAQKAAAKEFELTQIQEANAGKQQIEAQLFEQKMGLLAATSEAKLAEGMAKIQAQTQLELAKIVEQMNANMQLKMFEYDQSVRNDKELASHEGLIDERLIRVEGNETRLTQREAPKPQSGK
jgi:hypothetical protein